MTVKTTRLRRMICVVIVDRRYVGRLVLDRETAAELVAQMGESE